MTLEEAVEQARMEVIAEFAYKGKPDLNNQRSADEHDKQMHKLFNAMAAAEDKVRRNWKASTKQKVKDTE